MICPCKSQMGKGECAYHGWFLEYRVNKLVAKELDISILQLPEVDIVLFNQALAIVEAEILINQSEAMSRSEAAANETIH